MCVAAGVAGPEALCFQAGQVIASFLGAAAVWRELAERPGLQLTGHLMHVRL